MARRYRMGRRAEAQEETRNRILRATMELHDEQGVAATTFADVATRAGVGQATVHRHFASVNDLVRACGAHVWQEMRPPMPELVPAVFAGCRTQRDRLHRLVEELDAFYRRGAFRLEKAAQDRGAFPELEAFLTAVDAGVAALVREALRQQDEQVVQVVTALTGLSVWRSFEQLGLAPDELVAFKVRMLEAGAKAIQRA